MATGTPGASAVARLEEQEASELATYSPAESPGELCHSTMRGTSPTVASILSVVAVWPQENCSTSLSLHFLIGDD